MSRLTRNWPAIPDPVREAIREYRPVPRHRRQILKTSARQLAFGVPAGGLLNGFPRCFQSNLAAEHRAQFAVADEIKWFRILAQAVIEQRLRFAHPSLL